MDIFSYKCLKKNILFLKLKNGYKKILKINIFFLKEYVLIKQNYQVIRIKLKV